MRKIKKVVFILGLAASFACSNNLFAQELDPNGEGGSGPMKITATLCATSALAAPAPVVSINDNTLGLLHVSIFDANNNLIFITTIDAAKVSVLKIDFAKLQQMINKSITGNYVVQVTDSNGNTVCQTLSID